MLNIIAIENAKHVLIKTDNNSFANAVALYTYLLTLHKKITLYSEEKIAPRFSFLPWFDKVKSVYPLSADLVLEVDADTLNYFLFFQKNEININKKMATALYCGLLERYENFGSSDVNGMVFATASELVALGAVYKEAQISLTRSKSLAFFRLKARLYAGMKLVQNAREVELVICDEDLSATGALLDDAWQIMKEFLFLVHVEKVTLRKSDSDMKILKIVKEIRFE